MVRPICATSSEWVRRTHETSSSGAAKTCVLLARPAKAARGMDDPVPIPLVTHHARPRAPVLGMAPTWPLRRIASTGRAVSPAASTFDPFRS